ncbi:YbaN family protein [Desulfogranum marinum]|uniref:YbaN family protein n=1 Tax=Desulfogranum marinum TaxID=453220 RepID=UPI0019661285|nr:YbaN family protein [Desulfogranum marinum]MBM9512240.1 YbaN family protein [Desulfogranum marinum]
MKAVSEPLMRVVLKIGACICIGLGVIGAFLPLLPTTPFLILATLLSYNSSPKIRQWLLDHPVFGETIQNYIENRSITIPALRSALVTLWLGLLISICLVSNIWVGTLLLVIGGLVTLYLLGLQRESNKQ